MRWPHPPEADRVDQRRGTSFRLLVLLGSFQHKRKNEFFKIQNFQNFQNFQTSDLNQTGVISLNEIHSLMVSILDWSSMRTFLSLVWSVLDWSSIGSFLHLYDRFSNGVQLRIQKRIPLGKNRIKRMGRPWKIHKSGIGKDVFMFFMQIIAGNATDDLNLSGAVNLEDWKKETCQFRFAWCTQTRITAHQLWMWLKMSYLSNYFQTKRLSRVII